MSRYGITVYGTDYYGEAVDNAFDSTPLTAVSVSYKDVLISWQSFGGSWSEQRLVRSSVGIPQSVDDGVTILREGYGEFQNPVVDYDHGGAAGAVGRELGTGWMVRNPSTLGNSTSFYDRGLTSGRFYYYALFAFDANLGIWRNTGSAQVLLAKDYGYTRRLYDRLPEVFRTTDYDQLDGYTGDDESSFLFRFLSVFGYQLDYIRTETEALKHLLEARTLPVSLLPALAGQVGVQYEPSIGPRAIRRLIRNAVHLYGLKGTRKGTQELADIATGWPARVLIGRNLALDDLDAGPKGSEGRWRGAQSCTVGYTANRGELDGPAGTGVLEVTITEPSNVAVINMDRSNGDNYLRLQYAIPVAQGRDYTTSIYARSFAPGGICVSRIRVTWLDTRGRQVGQPVESPIDFGTGNSDWVARPYLTATAPVGARYLEAALVYEYQPGFTVGSKLYACGFMVDESSVLRDWQCAREIIVNLQADAVNESVMNRIGPNGQGYLWQSTDGAVLASALYGDPNYPDGDHYRFEVQSDTTPSFRVLPGATGAETEMHRTAPGQPWFLSADVLSSSADRAVAFTATTVDEDGNVQTQVIGKRQSIAFVPGYQPFTDTEDLESDSSLYQRVTAVLPPGFFPPTVRTVTFGLQFYAQSSNAFPYGSRLFLRNWGVFKTATPVDYFDGGVRTPTQDNLWEGAPYRSRSHHYSQRTARAQRLRDLLKDYLPFGSCYALAFAQPIEKMGTLVGSPAAIEGYDINPGDPPPPPPVGRGIELRWNSDVANSKTLTLRWNVGSLMVGRSLSVRFRQTKAVGRSITALYDVKSGTTTGSQLDLQWTTFSTNAYIDPTTYTDLPAGWTYDASDGSLQTRPSPGDQTIHAGLYIPQANWPVFPTTRALTDKIYRVSDAGVVSLHSTGTVQPYTGTATDGYGPAATSITFGAGFSYHHREVLDDLGNLIYRDYGGLDPAALTLLYSQPDPTVYGYAGTYDGGY